MARFLRDMGDLELFNPAFRVLVDCLKFCFIGVLRKGLKEMPGGVERTYNIKE